MGEKIETILGMWNCRCYGIRWFLQAQTLKTKPIRILQKKLFAKTLAVCEELRSRDNFVISQHNELLENEHYFNILKCI